MGKAIDSSCHHSHFGSRYTSGCCDLAGLLPEVAQFNSRSGAAIILSGVEVAFPSAPVATPLVQEEAMALRAIRNDWGRQPP